MKLVTALLMAALAVSGCVQHTSSHTRDGMLVFADGNDVSTLNPHLSAENSLSLLSSLTMARLTRFGQDGRLHPELATVIPSRANGGVSADGKTIVWKLRSNVKWSDGAAFTSDDVVFSVRVVQNPDNNEVFRSGFDSIVRVDAPDKYTAVFHLKRPYSQFVRSYFGTTGSPCILPAHILGGLKNINSAPYNSLPVGIGPFRYKEWRRGDRVVLEANPFYFRGLPRLKTIVYQITSDRNTVATLMQTGEIDLWPFVAPIPYDRLRRAPNVILSTKLGFAFKHLEFNTRHSIVSDVRVRQALELAIDRQRLLRVVDHGLGTLSDGPISPIDPLASGYRAATSVDLDAAVNLLSKAGWHVGEGGVRYNGNRRLTITFAVQSGAPDIDATVELIRDAWQRLGIDLTVLHYPADLLYANMGNGGILDTGKFDVTLFTWHIDSANDLENIYTCRAIPPLGENDARYCSSEFDRGIRTLQEAYDENIQRAAVRDMQNQIIKDVPIVVLEIENINFAQSPRVHGFKPISAAPFDDMMNVSTD